ncbi:hypothetical protein DAEQUDRAFT_422163 [Daedalea quercina L-15889]|uniref:DUF4604 domain-containing protein n=1 Tax=Daedalea quercina L-15889 TaxID=1314783 RepID=A0A165TLX7_9APHY|nr:hypothetical protein DAEQUDRAFT_422163 [Daedalea quercina L-15889]
MSKEPTRHQLSSRLSYNAYTPAFLQRLQGRINGTGRDEEDDEYEYDGSGRPPIPKRPAIPERPDDDPGSGDEDDGDEKPQVVVLREGKHLSEKEVENEKRKARGLPPLPESEDYGSEYTQSNRSKKGGAEKQTQSLSFGSIGAKTKTNKRKAVGDALDDEPLAGKSTKTKKKQKKAEKKLLSFGDES